MNKAKIDELQCYRSIGTLGDSSCEKLDELIHCRNCPEYSKAGKQLFDRDIPKGYMDEWTKIYAKEKETENIGNVAVIVFCVNGELLALKALLLQEVADVRTVHSVPFRSDTVFKGLVNIHGELLPCFSISDALDLIKEYDTDTDHVSSNRMIIVDREGERFVFQVDRVVGVIRISEDSDISSPDTMSGISSSLLKGVFNHNGEMVGLLDDNKLFDFLNRSLLY